MYLLLLLLLLLLFFKIIIIIFFFFSGLLNEYCLSVAMQPSLLRIATVFFFFKITPNHYKTPCIVYFLAVA